MTVGSATLEDVAENRGPSQPLIARTQRLRRRKNDREPNETPTVSVSGGTLHTVPVSSREQQHAEGLDQRAHTSTDLALPGNGTLVKAVTDGMCAHVFPTQAIREHPLYRLPTLLPGVNIGRFDWEAALQSSAFPRKVPQKLLEIQKILRKRVLSQDDANKLKKLASDLLMFAVSTKESRLVRVSCGDLIAPLSFRFLVAEALWCACEILGPAAEKHHWWDSAMDQLTASPLFQGSSESEKCVKSEQFVLQLIAALSVYRKGDRPSPQEVMSIKKTMFGPPPVHFCFTAMVWDWWRRDLASSDQRK
ncbi:LOW QUALITY PROTEIN: uncharacterized protein EMH_0053200 [Eimeria mitis]|uniref:Uncharacterized protein n=1 Tax=Eimeria mitis TaxID=44415 RepID=U6JWS3_9EIME|nr:LOW QUALITY PROTEIN: uncharacterized protein EMH_0053200 [Eimeria mitis]CDJ29844.1 hypothetical protein, conserved [Eimeria mitis]